MNSLVVYLSLVAMLQACFVTAFQSHSASSIFKQTSVRSTPSFKRSPDASSSSSSSTTTTLYSSLAVTTALSTLDAFAQSSPYAAAATICGFKASMADMIAQKRAYRKREEKEREDAAASNSTDAVASLVVEENKADWKRNVAFIVYGSLYQGVTQEFVYNHVYPVWFGTGTGVTVVLSKVCFDLLIQTTLVTLPIAYLTKSVIYRYSFKEAIRRYVDDIQNHGLLKKYFLLWGPVQCLTFSVVPEHWRITWVACVSFFWLIILSTIAGKARPVPETADVAAATAATECSLEDGLTCNIDG